MQCFLPSLLISAIMVLSNSPPLAHVTFPYLYFDLSIISVHSHMNIITHEMQLLLVSECVFRLLGRLSKTFF